MTSAGDPWVSTRTAYYPLWRARVEGLPAETRRGRAGDLEVQLDPGATRVVDLDYRPGVPETCGLVVTALGLVGLIVLARRGRAA